MKISVREKIGYGLGDTASNIVFQMVIMFMAFFYTDIFGISAAAMGTLFLVVRIVDAVTDPVMGAIADRTETRWGKFRPFLLWLCVPYGVIAVIAFTTPDFDANGKLIYAYITYSLLMIAYTAINIPYCALGGVITPDTRERVSLNSYRFFLATVGGVLVTATTLTMVEKLGGGNDQKGYQLAMVVLASIAVLMFLVSFATTRERVVEAAEKSDSTLRHDLKVLAQNDQFLITAALNFVLLIAVIIRGGVAIYYMTWFVERADLATAFLTTGMVSAAIGAGLASTVTRWIPKTRLYVIIQVAIAVLSSAFFFVGNDNLTAIFVLFALVQFFVQMGAPLLWTMMADSVDYGEWKSERRITGLVFAGSLFALKMGMALGGAILGWLLAYYGYQGDADVQTPAAVGGIVTIFSIVPAVGHVLLALIVTRYQLDQKRCDEIRLELDRRQAAV